MSSLPAVQSPGNLPVVVKPHLTNTLDKAGPDLFAAWHMATLSNVDTGYTLEVICHYGYCFFLFFFLYTTLSFLSIEQYLSEPDGGGVCTHILNQFVCFLSLCPLFLLFIKAPQNNKSPRN